MLDRVLIINGVAVYLKLAEKIALQPQNQGARKVTDVVLYTSEDGQTRLDLRVVGETVWLTQLEIAELFQTTKQNVSLHANNIFKEGELQPEATVKESLTVQTEGKREVQRRVALYNLDLILAIGYRIRSPPRHSVSSMGH